MRKAVSIAALVLLSLGSLPALAATPQAKAKAGGGSLDPAMSDAPDPLTPTESGSGPLLAPGAVALPADAATAAETAADPVVAAARSAAARVIGAAKGLSRDEGAALTAYYGLPNAKPIWTDGSGLTAKGQAAIAEIGKAADWGLNPALFELPSVAAGASVDAIAEAELKVSVAVLKYARHARGGRVDPGSISQLLDRKPRFYEPQSLLRGIAAAGEPDAYLRGLNPKHPQFELLRQAMLKLRAESEAPAGDNAQGGKASAKRNVHEEIDRILVNMERWRWMPDNLGDFYVWDSVPEQIARVIKDGKEVFHEKIVVGKASTPTPLFTANMQFVIFHPEWGVPDGIKTNELAPMLRRASNDGGWGFFGGGGYSASDVLRKYDLKISYNGQTVDPDSVNWGSTDIRRFNFIQPAGPRNVLGIVKFRFPNKHDVYMHDTPERNLFSNGVRAFSHGCMRVQNPVHLAEVILAQDKGWAPDRVDALANKGGGVDEIKLSNPVPVHITYFTVQFGADGKMQTNADIYGLDSRMASVLIGRSVDSVREQPEAKPQRVAQVTAPQQAPRNVRPKAKPVNKDTGDFLSGLFGN